VYVSVTVSVNLSKLHRFKGIVVEQLTGGYGPINDALKLWGVRYRSWAQQRFNAFSKGGGDWKPLADSTIAKRRRGTKSNQQKLKEIWSARVALHKKDSKTADVLGGQVSILRDTGLLFNALSPMFVGAPGALERRIKFGIRVGYGGPQKHTLGVKGAATIADIASFHQKGHLPHLPKREIIVNPPMQVVDMMALDIERAIERIAKNV